MLNLQILLKHKLNISQKLIQSLEILSMPFSELDNFLNLESQDNVMLGFESKFNNQSFVSSLREKYSSINNSPAFSIDDFLSKEESLVDYLLAQLREIKLSTDLETCIKYLILNIDNNGYLKTDLELISTKLNLNIETVEKSHEILMSFDPMGVGARNLKECLLAQTDKSDTILFKLIDNYLVDIANNNTSLILKSLDISKNEYLKLLSKIKNLNPKPGASFKSEDTLEYIVPDIFITIENNNINIEMELINEIHLNQHYLSLLEKGVDKETEKYLKEKLARTLMIMKSVDKRNETIRALSEFLVNYQKDFFISSLPLKSITQKDVADELNISISTVSRAVKNKYIQTPKGSFPLKNLFATSIDGNAVSKEYIKKLISTILESEDKKKPYSDEIITNKLTLMGINIKRRTVQKYREELNIPSSVKRKVI